MTLPVPILDDRSYDDFVSELLGRIPAYTPEWTNQQASDPGVTLLELFSFLAENLLFRFNQIPDATQLWLLRMLQVPPLPARPASGLVTLAQQSPSLAAPPQIDLASTVSAGSVAFETLQDLVSLPVLTRAIAKMPAAAPTTPELVAAVERAVDAAGGLPEGTQASFYAPLTLQSAPGAPGVDSLQVSQSIDGTLWVAVIAAPGVEPAGLLTPGSPLDGATLSIGIWPSDQYPTMAEVDPCAGLDPVAQAAQAAQPPTIDWQISVAATGADGNPLYLAAEVAADSTGGLQSGGVVSISLPPGLVAGGWPVGAATPPDPDLAGSGDWPPVLDDAPPLAFWLRAYPAAGAPAIADLAWVGANAVCVDQMQSAGPEFVGTGNGMAGQQLSLVNGNVDASSVVLQVEDAQQVWNTWTGVDSFAAAGPFDTVYVLDAASGTVTVGDTLRGMAIPTGARVRALSYRYGGGSAGNVAPGAISSIAGGAPVSVANPLALSGGADAETIEQAMTRIPAELSNHDRAVTSEDFANLAAIQGVGRAECLACFYPPTPAVQAAGVVTVVVWPVVDSVHPNAPTPDQGLLSAVCAQLDARRLVTTELYVVPPTYHQVAVSIGVHAQPGYSGNAICSWVKKVIQQYLSPLPPYGPSGGGWPLGRNVIGPELMAVALQVEGIDYLEPVALGELDSSGAWQSVASGTIELQPWEVVELSSITVVVGQPLDAGATVPGPPTPTATFPVPVPMDQC
jgi:predicted phage baseplate assembly protein